MKMCIAEINKKIKLLESEKQKLRSRERDDCTSTYQDENDLIENDYNFADTQKAVAELDTKVRKLKAARNLTNATYIVKGFESENMTLGECLVLMTQTSNCIQSLEKMASKQPLSRETSYRGIVEFTKLNYSPEDAKAALKEQNDKLTNLHLAIDRANLDLAVEVDETWF